MQKINKIIFYLISLGLGVGGFLLGNNWSNSALIFGPLLNYSIQLRVNAESYLLAHPVESGLVFAAVGSVIPSLARLWILLLWSVRKKKLIEYIFYKQKDISIILYTLKQTFFSRLGDELKVNIPNNSPVIPVSTAVSLSELIKFIQNNNIQKILHFTFDYDITTIREKTFFTVGGPYTNKIVKDILDRGLVPGLSCRSDGTEPTLVDQTDEYQATRGTGTQGADIVTDYGVFVYMANPWHGDNKICLAFGLYAFGTSAAIEVLFEGSQNSDNKHRIFKAIKKNKNVVSIIRVSVTDILESHGTIIKVREFK